MPLLSSLRVDFRPLRLAAILLLVLLAQLSSARAAGPSGPGEAATFPQEEDVVPIEEIPEARPPVPQPAPATFSLYTGYSWVEDSNFYYAGGIAALNGDLSSRDFLIQGFAGWGDYDYFNSIVPGGKVNGELTELSGLLGYQVFAGKVKFSAFAGVDWQDNKLSPRDPSNPVSGSETDFVATANMETTGPERLYLKLYGAYSIVNQTYWAKSRIGYKFGELRRFKIGPEGAFFGNENFNSQQVGAFVSIPLGIRLDVTLSGGFNFVANDEFFEQLETGFAEGSFGGLGGLTDGGYANVTVSTWF